MNTRAAPSAHTVTVPDTADRVRACCGPAHGRSWDIPAGQVAPEQVELSFCADALRGARSTKPSRDPSRGPRAARLR